jgi:hypothetical protein
MYVKNTKTIWANVEGEINNLFTKRLEYASAWENYGVSLQDFKSHCLDILMPPEDRVLVEKLGSRYFSKISQTRVFLIFYDGPLQRRESFVVDFTDKILAPSLWEHGNYYSQIPEITSPLIQEIASKRDKAIRQIKDDKDAMIKSMKELYESHPSVNSILKTFPSFSDFLPNTVMQTVAQKTKTPEKRELPLNDVSDLATQMLKAKVLK